MTRFEFTIKLRKALSGRVNHVIVNDNVAYYENYIDIYIKNNKKLCFEDCQQLMLQV